MALNAAIVWEVDILGSDENGGGFKSTATGTDRTYPNQPNPWVIFDGVTITGTVNATTTRLDIVGYAVSAADIGNVCQLSVALGALAFFEITAQGANYWTLDRAIGTAGQTVTGRMGGALGSPGKAAAATVSYNAVYVKSATYTCTTSTYGAGGPVRFGVNTFAIMRGYQNTRGDNTGIRPILSWGSVAAPGSVIYLFGGQNSLNQTFENLTADCNSVNNVGGFGGGPLRIYNCTAINGNGTAGVGFGGSYQANCYAYNCTIGFSNAAARYCYALGCGAGFSNTAAGYSFRNLAHDCTGSGFVAGAAVLYVNCLSDGNDASGFLTDGQQSVFTNCLSTNNGAYAYDSGTGGTTNYISLENCGAYNNTSGRLRAATWHDLNIPTITLDPYVLQLNDDFRLNNVAGGGASCIGAGIGVYGQTGPSHIGAVAPAIDFPLIEQVETGVAFGYNSSSTGTMTFPPESDVREDIGFGYAYGYDYDLGYENYEYFGSLDLPAVANVRLGTQFDNNTKTGTMAAQFFGVRIV